MSFPVAAIEDAIHDWVVAGSGLPASRVIWAQQNAPRPAAPYIALRITNLTRFGQDWHDIRDAAAPSPGAEIEAVARGTRTGLLNLQCFGDAATGPLMPVARLESVQLSAELPSRRDALCASGFGLLGFEPIVSVDGGATATVFEPRAVMDCRFNVASELVETLTFVEAVEVTDQITGDTFDVDLTP